MDQARNVGFGGAGAWRMPRGPGKDHGLRFAARELAFCAWLAGRAPDGDSIHVVFGRERKFRYWILAIWAWHTL